MCHNRNPFEFETGLLIREGRLTAGGWGVINKSRHVLQTETIKVGVFAGPAAFSSILLENLRSLVHYHCQTALMSSDKESMNKICISKGQHRVLVYCSLVGV